MLPRNKSLLIGALASVAVVALSLPTLGLAAPESLLPPGFGDAPADQPERKPAEGAASAPTATPDGASAATPVDSSDETATGEDGDDEKPQPVELPAAARRSLALVGPLTQDFGGLGEQAFGRTNGRYLGILMRRLDAPVASRWVSILLRRALLSRVPTPAHASPVDWVAGRASLLLRMGEADAARILVESIDVDRYTPRMIGVAQQVALATADPAMLCPIAETGQRLSEDKSWEYARAICAALSGEGANSTMWLDRGRGRGPRDIDFLLAERVVGAGPNTRHAAIIEWNGVDRLTSWRFGMASAVGLAIPEPLFATVGPQYQAWRARAPMVQPADRIGAARTAAALGVFSNAALVDLYGQVDEREGDVGRDTPAARLRMAYVGDDSSARMGAIRSFWEEAESQPGGLYAAEILTARAVARLKPDDSFAADYGRLVASMLSAALDVQAARWAPLVEGSSPSIGDEAWALLAVGAPARAVDISTNRIDGYGARLGNGGTRKMRVLVAALAGLGRISAGQAKTLAERFDVPLDRQTSYTRAIDRAAARGEQGTVALLAAVGMQTRVWRYVPPAHLYHVVAALRRTGNEPAARMIAAEALSRL